MKRVIDYFRAGIPYVLLRTDEPARAEKEISVIFSEYKDLNVVHWDPIKGFETLNGQVSFSSQNRVSSIIQNFNSSAQASVLIVWNIHRFLKEISVVQSIQNEYINTQKQKNLIIFLSPEIILPKEIEKLILIDEFEYPSKDQLKSYLISFCHQIGQNEIPNDVIEKIISLGLGPTKSEFMSALSLSIVRTGKINCKDVINIKKQLIQKNPVLEFYDPQDEDRFDNIGGQDFLKKFLLSTYKSPLAKGVLLLGEPGTGKSSIAKAMGGETGLPVLTLNFARSFGSLVGESEQRIISALKLIDSSENA